MVYAKIQLMRKTYRPPKKTGHRRNGGAGRGVSPKNIRSRNRLCPPPFKNHNAQEKNPELFLSPDSPVNESQLLAFFLVEAITAVDNYLDAGIFKLFKIHIDELPVGGGEYYRRGAARQAAE